MRGRHYILGNGKLTKIDIHDMEYLEKLEEHLLREASKENISVENYLLGMGMATVAAKNNTITARAKNKARGVMVKIITAALNQI